MTRLILLNQEALYALLHEHNPTLYSDTWYACLLMTDTYPWYTLLELCRCHRLGVS